MKTEPTPTPEKTFACETCAMRKKAEANPGACCRGFGAGTRAGAQAGKPTRLIWLNFTTLNPLQSFCRLNQPDIENDPGV
jgi:hypothetical protein